MGHGRIFELVSTLHCGLDVNRAHNPNSWVFTFLKNSKLFKHWSAFAFFVAFCDFYVFGSFSTFK